MLWHTTAHDYLMDHSVTHGDNLPSFSILNINRGGNLPSFSNIYLDGTVNTVNMTGKFLDCVLHVNHK